MKALIIIILIFVGVHMLVKFSNRRQADKNGIDKSETPNKKAEFTEEELNRYHEAKEAAMERVLGPMHDKIGHAIIPFYLGGAMDMYYFPKGIKGTGFATMELIEPDGSGSKPNTIGTYELVAFTKHDIKGRSMNSSPFDIMEQRMSGILTAIGFYSYETVLNPGDTCEVPVGDGEPQRCLILDDYAQDGIQFEINGKKHCLLLCLEVFRSEMEYAKKHGTAEVLKKLKEAGYYPYSDLDREPVF